MIDALTKSTFVKWYSQSTVYGYIHPSNSMYQTWNPENFSKRMGWIFNRKLPQIWEVKEIFYSLCLKRKNNLQHELVNRTSNTDPWRLTFKFRSYFLWKMLCHESNTSSSVQVSTSSFFSVNVRHILSFSTFPTRKTVKAWTRTSAKTQPSIFRRESPLTSLACADIRGLWSTLTKKVVDSGLIPAWYSHARDDTKQAIQQWRQQRWATRWAQCRIWTGIFRLQVRQSLWNWYWIANRKK